MGLFSFLGNVGKKLFGKDDAPLQEKEPVRVEQALKDMVSSMGLGIDNLGITFHDGTATVTGEAHSQSEREKVVLTVGNVTGVKQVDDQMTVLPQPEPEPEADFYTVESGDSLSKIAKQFYGDANKYMYIFEENKPMLQDPDEIYPGQVLRIPRL